jgi:hypothetical protein
MRTPVAALALFGLLMIASTVMADPIVFFEELFAGPTLDSAVWRTEILTSGPRFCPDSYPGGPGHWVDEGVECHAVAAYSPYGNAPLSDGLIHVSSTNGRAFPFLVSRLPGPVPTFPTSGDFTLTVRMRFDRITPWGTFVDALDMESTEPIGTNNPGPEQNVLHIAADGLYSFLSGSMERIADVPSPTEFHDFGLECVGNLFTVTIDGQVVYGPVASDMRPTAICLGNPVLAYWYPTDWTSLSVDDIRVEEPGPVPVTERTWGSLKAMYRE